MPVCMKCDRTFSSHRGLDIHRNRAHPVSDSYALDFMNLPEHQQELVLCTFEDLSDDGDGGISYARRTYGDAKVREDTFMEIISNPLDQERRARFTAALTEITGTEYRYLILEEP